MAESFAPNDITPCAEVSAALNEPMLGTAPQVGLWILLEVRDTWEPKNLKVNSLPPTANAWLTDAEHRANKQGLLPRVQFIKHRRRPSDPLTVMSCRDGILRRQSIDTYDELSDIDPLTTCMPVWEETLYLICTHGKRDICCSREGLPTWQRLDNLSGGRAWQATHLGGHRFAPNVLTLPSAHMYGRVYQHQAERFFNDVESNKVPTHFLRGNSTLPPVAQVCEPTIRSQGGQYLSISEDEVLYETTQGTQTLAIPDQEALEILSGCRDREWKTVMTYRPVAPSNVKD